MRDQRLISEEGFVPGGSMGVSRDLHTSGLSVQIHESIRIDAGRITMGLMRSLCIWDTQSRDGVLSLIEFYGLADCLRFLKTIANNLESDVFLTSGVSLSATIIQPPLDTFIEYIIPRGSGRAFRPLCYRIGFEARYELNPVFRENRMDRHVPSADVAHRTMMNMGGGGFPPQPVSVPAEKAVVAVVPESVPTPALELFRFKDPESLRSDIKIRIRDCENNLRKLYKDLESCCCGEPVLPNGFEQQLQRIQAISNIRCHCCATAFVIETDPVHVVVGDIKRNVGKLMMEIPWDIFLHPTTDIKIRNLTHIFGDVNAPHVRGSGKVCWGNAAPAIVQAVSDKDLETLVQILLAFVNNPNPDDLLGKKIHLYPEVDNVHET